MLTVNVAGMAEKAGQRKGGGAEAEGDQTSLETQVGDWSSVCVVVVYVYHPLPSSFLHFRWS